MKAITIGNKPYTIRYTINSLILLEDMLKAPFMEVFSNDSVSLKVMRDLVYCGLKENHKDLSLDSVGELMTEALQEEYELATFTEEFVGELTKALGMNKEKKVKNA